MIYRSPSRESAMDLMREGAFSQALPVLLQLLEDDPRDQGLHYMAGQCCRFTGDLAGAVRHLEIAAAQQPKDSAVLSALGIAHQLAGNLEAAALSLERAMEADPDSVTARNSLGVTFRKMGALSDALGAYDVIARLTSSRSATRGAS